MGIPDVVQARTHLAHLEHEYNKLDSLVSGGMIMLRNTLDMYETDVKKLRVDEAFEQMVQIKDSVHRMRELYTNIQKIKLDLAA